MWRLFGTDSLLYGGTWSTKLARVRRPLCVGRSGLLLGWWIQVWLEIRIVPAGLDAHPPIKKKMVRRSLVYFLLRAHFQCQLGVWPGSFQQGPLDSVTSKFLIPLSLQK